MGRGSYHSRKQEEKKKKLRKEGGGKKERPNRLIRSSQWARERGGAHHESFILKRERP